MANEIIWLENYLPGFADNFVSNEVIVSGLTTADVWPFLSCASRWPTYYANSANVRFYDSKGLELEDGIRFYFETFGFPVEAPVVHIALGDKTFDAVAGTAISLPRSMHHALG